MGSILMQPQFSDDDDDFGIKLNGPEASKDDDWESDSINMKKYADSPEEKEVTWMDALKEAGIQSAAGLAQAYTYPLDILKMAMVGEGLTDIDELEDAFTKAGKTFDRNKYVRTVMEQGEFVPTQHMLENFLDEKLGTNIAEPKTKTGKFFNKLFFLGGLTKGKGITKEGLKKGAKAGAIGSYTTSALRQIGAPEIVSELAGDVLGGIATIEKEVRKLSPEAKHIMDTADKYNLPLMEFMLEETPSTGAKISSKRKAAFEKELGMSTEEAINKIIEEKIPIAKLRKEGQNLSILEEEAYEKAATLAKKHKKPIDTSEYVNDIEREISRIRSQSVSPSDAEEAAIRVLEKEKNRFTNPPKKAPEILGPDGRPIPLPEGPKGKSVSAEKLVNQTRKYNSNVKKIYKKAEFSGAEDEVRQAYAFLNDRIRNTISKEGGKELIEAHNAANSIFSQNAKLARTEGLVTKAFADGNYSAKKLEKLLNSKQGIKLRKDIGEEGVKELQKIAKYGKKAQEATSQFAKSAKYGFNVSEWGPLAGFVLAKVPPAAAAASVAKPAFDYYRGWMLMNPATRKSYSNIIENASEGSFKNMSKDFRAIEKEVIKEFGSVDEFIKQGVDELKFFDLDED